MPHPNWKRDGNWLDEWGCCKVCGGEIPYGHIDNCDIFKLEQQVRAAQMALNSGEAVAPLPACEHEWVSMVNKVIRNGEMCAKCYALKPLDAAHPTKEEPATPDGHIETVKEHT